MEESFWAAVIGFVIGRAIWEAVVWLIHRLRFKSALKKHKATDGQDKA